MLLCWILQLAVRRLCTVGIRMRLVVEVIGGSVCTSHSRWRRGFAVGRHPRSRPSRELSLRHHSRLCPHQGVFYRTDQVGREDGSRVHRSRNRLLPRLEHLFHPLACGIVDDRVGFHEGFKEVSAEIQRIWRANILHDRVEDVECGQFLAWSRLAVGQRFVPSTAERIRESYLSL